MAILWNRRVVQFRWTEYTRKHIDSHFTDDWALQLSLAVDKGRYWIQGRSREGDWQELSQWRLDEIRAADDTARALVQFQQPQPPVRVAVGLAVQVAHRTDVEVHLHPMPSGSREETPEDVDGPVVSLVEQMRQAYGLANPKPGMGEAVVHLMDHKNRGPDETVLIVNDLAIWGVIHRKKLARHRKNGRSRKGECRFCAFATQSSPS